MESAAARRILLVEDDRLLRRACETSLRARGLTVLTAADGAEALAVAEHERVDLVLLDMVMPRLSGLEVLRALRREPGTAALPVLVLSNSSREADIDEVTRLGALGYWVKADLSLRELGERVLAVLDRLPRA
jgi:two-component system phosphate regulon response regulator PhoB